MSAKYRGLWSNPWRRTLLLVAIAIGTGNGEVIAQGALDLCGCRGASTLEFNAGNPATYPPGTSGCSVPCTSGTITFALPPDGVLKFKSFTADGNFFIRFAGNNFNTPVTILVDGDVVLRTPGFCCRDIDIGGANGSSGSASTAGVGGLGGPGGFRGGDGAAPGINLMTIGGAGLGPGGGLGATASANSVGGTFFGLPELLPLVGGSGGGGGTGTSTAAGCTGGGGGGGAGAIVIAANGTFTMHNYDIFANGGTGGSVGNGNCARGASGGSAGAIRLVANRFVHVGTVRLQALGGGISFSGGNGTPGRIRMESVDTSAQTQFSTDPPALRITGPGPLSNPVSPTVAITAINGTAVPVPPATFLDGFRGSIDLVLPAPGVTSVDIATTGVPSGTTVEVKVKPRVGANPVATTVLLEPQNCNTQGACTAATSFDLSAGAYIIEARATFQVQ